MAKGRFNRVRGTKDFLVGMVLCVFLCLWSIRDAWFPTEKVLKRHPLEFPVTVSVSGVVQDVPVKVGDEVGGKMVLLTLNSGLFEAAVAAAEKAYKDAKGGDESLLKEKLTALLDAREILNAATVNCDDFIVKTSHGEDALQGKVLEILTEPATEVQAGETVMVVRPKDTFYIFNKTLAILAFIGALVFGFFHRVASR